MHFKFSSRNFFIAFNYIEKCAVSVDNISPAWSNWIISHRSFKYKVSIINRLICAPINHTPSTLSCLLAFVYCCLQFLLDTLPYTRINLASTIEWEFSPCKRLKRSVYSLHYDELHAVMNFFLNKFRFKSE